MIFVTSVIFRTVRQLRVDYGMSLQHWWLKQANWVSR
jgi:hypothetical protein